MSLLTLSRSTEQSIRGLTVLLTASVLLSGCALPKFSASEQELAETLTPSKYQPATREFRDNVETQDLLTQAAFWSREHDLNPGDLEAAIKLAATVRKMGNPVQAIEITQQTRALYPRDPYLIAEYAAALIASERGEDALDTLDTALRTTPGYARLWSLKGAALDQTENYELARKHYAKALQITPYDPNILANIGLSYALSGDVRTAEGWLRRAADIPGAGKSVRQNLAIVLQLQGKADEAQSLLPNQRSASLGPVENYTPPRTQNPSYTQPSYTPPAHRSQTSALSGGNNTFGTQGSYGAPQSQPLRRAPQRTRTDSFQTQPHLRGSTPPQARSPFSPQTQSGQALGTQFTTQNSNGQSFSSASDAARAVAQNQTRKRAVSPLTLSGQTTAKQKSALDQIAANVGPKSAFGGTAAQASKAYYPGRSGQATPQTAPTSGAKYQQAPTRAQLQAQYQAQIQAQQSSPGGYPVPQFGGNYTPQNAAPQRRGPARER